MSASKVLAARCMRAVLVLSLASGIAACGPANDGADDDTVRLTPLVTLGDPDGPGSFVRFPIPSAPIGGERYLVTDGALQGTIPVFDASGQFVRSIGAFGSGPGEFRSIEMAVRLIGDSSLLIDSQLRQATVLDSMLKIVRTFRVPFAIFQLVQLSPERFVASTASMEQQSIFVLFDGQGEPIGEFGPRRESGHAVPPQWIANGTQGTLWSANWSDQYLLTHWDSLGRSILEVRPQSAWATAAPSGPLSPTVPPGWQIRGIWSVGDSAVAVVALVPDPDWASGLGEPQPGEGGVPTYKVEDDDKVHDTVVELVEVSTGQVLASRRFDQAYRMAPFPGVIGRHDITDEKGIQLVLMSVEFRPRRSP